jgi:hypothetical protein
MLNKKILIVSSIIFILWIFVSLILYSVTLPKKPIDITENLSSNINTYLFSIYHTSKLNTDFYTNFNWLWNTAPKELQNTSLIAQNLSVEWPPKKGSRFRMTAFPYPDTGKSKFWLFQFFKGISSLLDNTSDQVTFPGWQISIYDPLNPNENTWSKFLNKQIPWDVNRGAKPKDPNVSGTPVYMEVIHSCYVPPSMSYPYCDDGGYWLYGTSGSGIFWSSGYYHHLFKKGGCLVANNKIDAMFKLLETDEGLNALKIGTKDNSMTPIKYITNILKDGGGGNSITKAMKTVIDAFHNHDQIPKLIAFRTMEPSSAKFGWGQAITLTLLFSIILIAMLVTCIYRIIKRRPWCITFVWIVSLIVSFLLIIVIQWSVILEYMLRGFGYMTLDMALQKTGMTLEEFIYSSAGRDSKGKPTSKYNAIANSLAQTQMFDFDLDTFCNVNNLDSIIMHTQPNKSGSWAVEIMDVRNTPFKKDAKELKDLVYPLGLCGQPVRPEDKNWKFMPPLRQGPIEKSNLYLGYQPILTKESLCNCDEDAVAKQYNKGEGTLKKCVFCKGSISEHLC